jgi:hypothetical protein
MEITAKTKEGFEKIETAYNELPKGIQDKLESAKKSWGEGFTFNFSQQFVDKVKLIVPSATFVEHTNERIRILSENNDWFEYNYPAESFEVTVLKIPTNDYK